MRNILLLAFSILMVLVKSFAFPECQGENQLVSNKRILPNVINVIPLLKKLFQRYPPPPSNWSLNGVRLVN